MKAVSLNVSDEQMEWVRSQAHEMRTTKSHVLRLCVELAQHGVDKTGRSLSALVAQR